MSETNLLPETVDEGGLNAFERWLLRSAGVFGASTENDGNDERLSMEAEGRRELVKALKAQIASGRGPAHGLVIGTNRFLDMTKWDTSERLVGEGRWNPEAYSADRRPSEDSQPLFGLRVLITSRDPDALFAVTASEWEEVLAGVDRGESPVNPHGDHLWGDSLGTPMTPEEARQIHLRDMYLDLMIDDIRASRRYEKETGKTEGEGSMSKGIEVTKKQNAEVCDRPKTVTMEKLVRTVEEVCARASFEQGDREAVEELESLRERLPLRFLENRMAAVYAVHPLANLFLAGVRNLADDDTGKAWDLRKGGRRTEDVPLGMEVKAGGEGRLVGALVRVDGPSGSHHLERCEIVDRGTHMSYILPRMYAEVEGPVCSPIDIDGTPLAPLDCEMRLHMLLERIVCAFSSAMRSATLGGGDRSLLQTPEGIRTRLVNHEIGRPKVVVLRVDENESPDCQDEMEYHAIWEARVSNVLVLEVYEERKEKAI